MSKNIKLKIMKELLSKFDRIRLTKPKMVVDASVILETVFETDFCCTNYIKGAGFDYQAFITIPLLGETVLKIISNLSIIYTSLISFIFILPRAL